MNCEEPDTCVAMSSDESKQTCCSPVAAARKVRIGHKEPDLSEQQQV
jgi:hypothetical protein